MIFCVADGVVRVLVVVGCLLWEFIVCYGLFVMNIWDEIV